MKKDLEEKTDRLAKVLKTGDSEKKNLQGQIAEVRASIIVCLSRS